MNLNCLYISMVLVLCFFFFFFQAEDGIRDVAVTGVQTCALPIWVHMDRPKHRTFFFLVALAIAASAFAGGSRDEKWVATWTTSPQGPYPIGYTVGQPLMSYALPGDVAHEQSFRLVVHPSVWGESWRIRLSNNFGNAPIVIGHAYIGVQ